MKRSEKVNDYLASLNEDLVLFEDVDFSDISAVNCEGENALHIAVVRNDIEIAKELIKLGIFINARGDLGDTPLHNAASRGNKDMVQLLVEAGADLFALNEGHPPFTLARFSGADDICDYLGEKMKEASSKDNQLWLKAQIKYLEGELNKLKSQLSQ